MRIRMRLFGRLMGVSEVELLLGIQKLGKILDAIDLSESFTQQVESCLQGLPPHTLIILDNLSKGIKLSRYLSHVKYIILTDYDSDIKFANFADEPLSNYNNLIPEYSMIYEEIEKHSSTRQLSGRLFIVSGPVYTEE